MFGERKNAFKVFEKSARETFCKKFLSRFFVLYLSDLAVAERVVEEDADEFVAGAVGLARKAVERLRGFFLNADRKSLVTVVALE